jgi:hypothetical protein
MRRFTSTEVAALLLGALFFVVGLVSVVHPTESAWAHPTTDPATFMAKSYIEVISKKGARIYGGLAMSLGVGLMLFVILPRRK